MKFDELEKKMRVYETAADICVLPGMFMIARLDGPYRKKATNPVTNDEVIASRRRICVNKDLPTKDQYGEFVTRTILQMQTAGAS